MGLISRKFSHRSINRKTSEDSLLGPNVGNSRFTGGLWYIGEATDFIRPGGVATYWPAWVTIGLAWVTIGLAWVAIGLTLVETAIVLSGTGVLVGLSPCTCFLHCSSLRRRQLYTVLSNFPIPSHENFSSWVRFSSTHPLKLNSLFTALVTDSLNSAFNCSTWFCRLLMLFANSSLSVCVSCVTVSSQTAPLLSSPLLSLPSPSSSFSTSFSTSFSLPTT